MPQSTRRGRQRGAVLGDHDDPGDAPAGQRCRPAGPAGPTPGRRAPPSSPRTVAGPDDGRDDQVGGDGHQADLAGDRRDQRRARQLGRRRHRDGLGEPPRQPARQCVPPRRRDQQDACGREHREREPRRARQARVDEQQPDHGRRRGRGRRGAGRRRPSPTRATAPMAAARSTLGSVRASSTKPTIPATPTTPSQRPRTPTQRATTSRNPTTRVRFVPETAVRWVSPVVRKSSTSPGGIPASSPSTRAGTSARWLAGRWATASRIEARRASVARQAAPAAAAVSGGPRGVTVAARSPASSTGASRPVKRIRSPMATRSQASSPNTRTGWCPTHRRPAPAPGRRSDPRSSVGRSSPCPSWSSGRAAGRPSRPAPRAPPRTGPAPPPRPHRPRASIARAVRAARRRPGRRTATSSGAAATRASTQTTPGRHRTAARQPRRQPGAAPQRPASARSAGARRAENSWGGHSVTYGRELGQGDLADPVHVEELVDRGERAVLGPPGQDRLGGHRADVGQRLEGDLVGGVEVDQRGDRGGAAGHRCRDHPSVRPARPGSARRRPGPGRG